MSEKSRHDSGAAARRRKSPNPAIGRLAWLRAAVLGANDGIVSTASLLLGVASAGTGRQGLLVAGTAALVAGAMSMAAGEYVSVHSQADSEARLGVERSRRARPLQAAAASAMSFALGAALPLAMAVVSSASYVVGVVAGASFLFLAGLGAASAKLGGTPMLPATARVAFWGAVAMAVTSGVGALFGTAAG